MYLEEQNLITPSYHHSVIYINFMEMGAIHVKRSFRDIIKRNIESFYSHMHSASSLMPRNPHITNKMDDTMIYSYCAIIFYISFFHAHSTYMEKRQNGVITQNTAEYALFCQEEGFKWCDLLIRTVYNLYYGESSVSKNYSFDPIDFDDILFSELAWVMDYEWLAVSNETGQYNIGRDDALYEDPM
jgi:hypothetical protein